MRNELTQMVQYQIYEDHRPIYQTIVGSFHLDQSYTVFGEVVSGMDVVDQITGVETRKSDDCPETDVRILKVILGKRKQYK